MASMAQLSLSHHHVYYAVKRKRLSVAADISKLSIGDSRSLRFTME